MNIALIGYGKMGQAIHRLAPQAGAKITLIVDSSATQAHAKTIQEADFSGVDVAIDFTNPESAFKNLEALSEKKVNVVMGTTGWYNETEKFRALVEKSGIGFLWASNFSIGVHLFWEILRKAGATMKEHPEYKVTGHEWHHTAKKDAPSGTAVSTANILKESMPALAKDFTFGATREGEIPGTHTVYFDSAVDSIEISHKAKNRDGFALGSLHCAAWLKGKKGFYSIEDYLK